MRVTIYEGWLLGTHPENLNRKASIEAFATICQKALEQAFAKPRLEIKAGDRKPHIAAKTPEEKLRAEGLVQAVKTAAPWPVFA